MAGDDVLMVSGTDEHGTPITVEAARQGLSAQEFADVNNAKIVDDLIGLGMSYDLFTRTTTENHYSVVQKIFLSLLEQGHIFTEESRQPFDSTSGRALPDRYLEGTCPICSASGARGDQCDNCGSQLDPQDLIDPVSKLDGLPPEWRLSEHFYLNLPAFQEELGRWIGEKTEWRPNVRSYSTNFIKETRPRAITRDIDWGVPIPLEGYGPQSTKRIYVWFDAVIGYLSAAIEWAGRTGDADAWKSWWLNPDTYSAYFMGKDNIVFHSVIWPSILLGTRAQDVSGTDESQLLQLPSNIFSSEFLTMEGAKFSSSRGIVIYVRDVLDRYGPDPLRYYLAAAGPETSDSDFTWEEFVRRNNEELVANWGNLVNRTSSLLSKYFDGKVPESTPTAQDDELLTAVATAFTEVGAHIGAGRFKAGLGLLMQSSASVNKYLSDEEPWKLAKTDMPRAATVLATAINAIASINRMFAPFVPHAANRVAAQLGLAPVAPLPAKEASNSGSHHVITVQREDWPEWTPGHLPAGHALGAPEPAFKLLDESIIAEELARFG